MKTLEQFFSLLTFNFALPLGMISMISVAPVAAQTRLFVAYPSPEHQTTSDRIFLIGTAPLGGEVQVNGQVIDRSPAGHFAPSFPLSLGENTFTLRYQEQELIIKVTRSPATPPLPEGVAFVPNSLTPARDISRQPGELFCFSAVAAPGATVSVTLADQMIPLMPDSQSVELPDNKAVLTGLNEPTTGTGTLYRGCAQAQQSGELGAPQFQLTLNGETITQAGAGKVTILTPTQVEIAEVIAEQGVARTGPSTNYSRLTPLPKGTRAMITGREGDYLRLDYGGWIKADETRIFSDRMPPRSYIRSVGSRTVGEWLEVRFPLSVPVPVTIDQGDDTLTLTLHNTTAQTDTIRFDDHPLIARLDWKPLLSPMAGYAGAVEYTFRLKSRQQWGYKLHYDGTTLVLSVRYPPQTSFPNDSSRNPEQPLAGVTILLDAGHGSSEDLGARGPTGYPEKDVTLIVSKLLRDQLIERGAQVVMTREGDDDLWPHDRVAIIEKSEPNLALSIHYNALPDNGDAIKTQGVGMFWYHPQAHGLAVFLHHYLVETLNRPSYGVFWNNLALSRPAIAPSLLLELGFMINPEEFEWIMNPQEQQKLAIALANGIVAWMEASQ